MRLTRQQWNTWFMLAHPSSSGGGAKVKAEHSRCLCHETPKTVADPTASTDSDAYSFIPKHFVQDTDSTAPCSGSTAQSTVPFCVTRLPHCKHLCRCARTDQHLLLFQEASSPNCHVSHLALRVCCFARHHLDIGAQITSLHLESCYVAPHHSAWHSKQPSSQCMPPLSNSYMVAFHRSTSPTSTSRSSRQPGRQIVTQ
jgi:hypothetical protein